MPNYSIIGSDGDGYLTQGWGIYTQSINGSYTSATWAFTAREGGSGDFGFRLSGETFASDTGYWIADIDAVFNTDRTIDAGVSGTFLTPTKLGDISGQLMGAFHPDPQVAGSGTWEAAGIGVWASEALSFVSSIVPAIKSLTVTEVTVNLIDGWGEKIGAKGGVETLIEYTYYSDFSQGYRKEYGYEYDKNGNFKGYKQGSYEATYYPDGHYEMTKYTKKDGWVDETGTWTYNDIKNIGVINQPMTTSGETQEFVTASGSLSVSDAGSAFFTSLAGGTGPISWGGTSPITLIGALNSTGAAGNAWKAELYSYDYINSTNTTYQGGAYYGYLLGPKSGSLRSLFVALYVDPADGLGVSRSGYLFGKLDGTVYSDLNMVKATGDITATIMDLDCGITAAGLYSAAKSTDTFTWGGMAPFGVDGTGSLRGYSSGDMLGLSGENWGIWTAFIGGNYEKPAPGPTGPAPITEWSLPFGGISAGGAYMLGKIAGGAWSETDQAFSGDLSSLYFIRGAGDSVRAGVIEGAVEGNYIEIDETTGTWNAAAAGEWVEVTDLLDQTKMFGPEGLTVLDRLLSSSVPITEVYSNMLTGSGSIAGGVTVTNLADFLNFSFTNWADYKWIADYAGRTNGIDITGQAGGTYSVPDVNGSGTFVGVGAGANETVINTVNVAGNYGPAGTIPNMTADVNLYEAPEAAPN